MQKYDREIYININQRTDEKKERERESERK
jgi:hypothetical protein